MGLRARTEAPSLFFFSVGPFMHSFVCSGMQRRGRWGKGERQMGCFRLNLQRIQHAGTCSAFVRGNRYRDIYSILTSGWFLDLPQKYSCDLSTGTTAFDLYSRWSYTGGKPISDHRYIYFFTFPDIFVLLVTACAVLGMADRLSSRDGSFWNSDAGRTHVSSVECWSSKSTGTVSLFKGLLVCLGCTVRPLDIQIIQVFCTPTPNPFLVLPNLLTCCLGLYFPHVPRSKKYKKWGLSFLLPVFRA